MRASRSWTERSEWVLVSQLIDSPDDARAAAERQEWRAAYDAYSRVTETALDARDLELKGDAAWWRGKLDEAIGLRERAHTAYTSTGDVQGAARVALALSSDYAGRGTFAVAHGWLANAERLLDGQPESPEHAILLLTQARLALVAQGDLPLAMELFDESFEVGRRVGSRDVQTLSLSGKGAAFIHGGEVEKGLALLDEATASAMSGGLQAQSTGVVYCITISSCRDLGDYRRAAEWTEVANRWCDRLDVAGFPGACRVHRAEVMRLRGDWTGAEAQALAACEELQDFDRHVTAGGHYEIAEIRRQRGDIAGAEAAYGIANELGRDPQPGLALLRLAEGKVAASASGVARALAEVHAPLARIRLLAPQVEIATAAGDAATARAAADELEAIVDGYKIGERRAAAFDATVEVARGRIALVEGDSERARAALQRGRDGWQAVGAPYETARARMLLGTAYREAGDEHAAHAELEAALATFERLGAGPDASRVRELLGRVDARRTFMFTDIVDSTKLLETLGQDRWKRLLNRHNQLVREQIAAHGGEVVKQTGDGFFASFETAKTALDTAVAIQRVLAEELVAPDIRIGAHAGEAFRTEGATDYGGQGVHVAARIGAAAGAGEILVSAGTLVGLDQAFRVSEPRTEQLKGFEQPVEVVSVEWR
jgi:class 3 adenylate cyclase